jgi:hypothetical protein
MAGDKTKVETNLPANASFADMARDVFKRAGVDVNT